MDLAAANAAHFSRFFDLLGRDTPKAEHSEGPGWVAVVSGAPHPLGNYAILQTGVDAEGCARALANLDRPGLPTSVFFTIPDLEEGQTALMEAGGYALAGQLPLMAVELSKLSSTQASDGVECRRIAAAELEEWASLLADSYGLPRILGELCAETTRYGSDAADSTMQFYAVYDAGRMVSTSQLFLCDGLAGIYCVTTHPDFRGRGYGALATAEPLRLAAGLGCEIGILQASTMGLPVYERIGFEVSGTAAFYVREG